LPFSFATGLNLWFPRLTVPRSNTSFPAGGDSWILDSSEFDTHAINKSRKGGEKRPMETGSKKTWPLARARFNGDRPAENDPDPIFSIPDSINLRICVHLCLSVAKAAFYPRQKHPVPKIIRVNPGKSRIKNKTRPGSATLPVARHLGLDSIVSKPYSLTFRICVHPCPSVIKNSGNRLKRFVIEFPAAKGYGWGCQMEFTE
jgi:hypothetical protein